MREERKRAQLAKEVDTATAQDEAEYQAALARYRTACEELDADRTLASRVLTGDVAASQQALEARFPFDEIPGKSIAVEVSTPLVHTNLRVLDAGCTSSFVVLRPDYTWNRKIALPRFEPIPEEQAREHYRDYVCSSVLRVAREVFTILPAVDTISIDAKASRLNDATGHIEEQTIVSASIGRSVLHSLNFTALDPYAAILSFPNAIDWRSTDGFNTVMPLSAAGRLAPPAVYGTA
jgi:hypothetical protein